jgi:hypothetical protein
MRSVAILLLMTGVASAKMDVRIETTDQAPADAVKHAIGPSTTKVTDGWTCGEAKKKTGLMGACARDGIVVVVHAPPTEYAKKGGLVFVRRRGDEELAARKVEASCHRATSGRRLPSPSCEQSPNRS